MTSLEVIRNARSINNLSHGHGDLLPTMGIGKDKDEKKKMEPEKIFFVYSSFLLICQSSLVIYLFVVGFFNSRPYLDVIYPLRTCLMETELH